MPFAMTHLCIAHNILRSTDKIKKPCDFMLGAIAPDSVHFADDYNSDMKKKSHLKENLLHSLFLHRKSVDVSLNKYVTLPCIQKFISGESEYIADLLFGDR